MAYDSDITDSDGRGFWLLAIPVGVILLIYSLVAGINEARFRNWSTVTDALITKTETHTASKGDSWSTSTYTFSVKGKDYSGEINEGSKGEIVRIRYITSDPSHNRLAHENHILVVLATVVIGGGLLGMGLGQFLSNDDIARD